MKILLFFHNTIYCHQGTNIAPGEEPPHHQNFYAKLHGLYHLVLVRLKSIYFGLLWPYNSAVRPSLWMARRAVHSLTGLSIAIADSFGVVLGLAIMRRSTARAFRAVKNLARSCRRRSTYIPSFAYLKHGSVACTQCFCNFSRWSNIICHFNYLIFNIFSYFPHFGMQTYLFDEKACNIGLRKIRISDYPKIRHKSGLRI